MHIHSSDFMGFWEKGLLVAYASRYRVPIVLHLRPGVREHYLGWLGTAHPELANVYASLYPRSYAPKAYQEEATAPARLPGG